MSKEETIQTKQLDAFIRDINNNYIYWDKFKDMRLPLNALHEEVWENINLARNQGYGRKLLFGNFNIKWWISNTLEATLHQLDIALAGGMELQILLAPKKEHRYRTNALLEESIASAQLSGAVVSKKSVREMLVKKHSPQIKEERICINIFKALQLANNYKNYIVDETIFLSLHQQVTKDTIKLKGIGKYRTNNKTDLSLIETTEYKSFNAAHIVGVMQQIFDLYNDDKMPFFIHPLVKASLLHYLIIYIRPFTDGNGRMARLVSAMYLLKKGYWVTDFMPVSSLISKLKPQYHKAIVHSLADDNAGYFVNFCIQSLQMSYRSLKQLVEKASSEKLAIPAKKITGYNERQTAILQWIKDEASKMVTIRELRTIYGISKETARIDLTMLVEKELLKYYHLNKKTYAFIKGDKFDEMA